VDLKENVTALCECVKITVWVWGRFRVRGGDVEESFSRACREESFSRIVVSSEETNKGRLINIYIY
jgi:hypothetical protein